MCGMDEINISNGFAGLDMSDDMRISIGLEKY
jgi:hypothetical protein